MPAPKEIIKLVKRFDEQKDSYLKSDSEYGETEVRRDFIDPFFKELGWDMDNSNDYAQTYRDVIHEDKVLVGRTTKAPDYSFRIGGVRKFFVEAKKPAVEVVAKSNAAFQIRRYGWSAKLPISILTNFEDLIVYDTTIQPEETDRAGVARIAYFHYKNYDRDWDEIADLFSKNAIQRGRLDKFLAKPRKGIQTVDEAFLAEIEQWRERLAEDIYHNNRQLSERELNTAVQLIIDRIIFLRICEDRGIEPENKLQRISTQPRIYNSLKKLFQNADDRYNSGLFHFKDEEEQSSDPDTLTPKLKITDFVLKGIFNSLYYPNPYEFSVIPADILGHIYERFLGKVIRLTETKAKVESEPEVQIRKAGGIYYTPSHIVDYIVENTLGDLLKDSTPAKIAKIRILDPACGSGSFLIVAYEYLLKWHLKYYLDHPKDTKDKIVRNEHGVPQLSIVERKRILRKNIFGTDIDAQAVEVTKLSLLLKLLEGANRDTITKQFKLLSERVLPDLSSNIKCGNSLIGSDFYNQKGLPNLNDEDHYRINVFDWDGATGFPEIMKDGGFNVIIGNPPYIFARDEGFTDYEKAYFYGNFTMQSYQLNTYHMFVELGLELLKKNGKFGYIIPNNWLTVVTSQSFRDHILSNTGNLHIVNYDYKVFEDAAVDTSTLIFEKTKPSTVKLLKALKDKPKDEDPEPITECDPQILIGRKSIPLDKTILTAEPILHRMNEFKRLRDYAVVKCGLKVYQTGKGKPPQTKEMTKERIYHAGHKKDKSYQKYLRGRNVTRYGISWAGIWVTYGKHLAEPRNINLFQGERILVRCIPKPLPYSMHAMITNDTFLHDTDNIIIRAKDNHNIKVILGLLNSKLITFWSNATYQKLQRKIFPRFIISEIANFPMALDTPLADEIADKVDELMNLLPNVGKNPNPAMKLKLKKLNDDLDTLAYQAYGLSKEDIDFIEKSILPVEPPKSP